MGELLGSLASILFGYPAIMIWRGIPASAHSVAGIRLSKCGNTTGAPAIFSGCSHTTHTPLPGGAIAPMPGRHLTPYGGGRPAELPTTDLAADYSLALTSWADACACSAPTLAGVTRASNDAPATKVEGNVSLQSPLSPGGGNALEYARCCSRQQRTMSRLGSLWSKIEGSNRANCDSSH